MIFSLSIFPKAKQNQTLFTENLLLTANTKIFESTCNIKRTNVNAWMEPFCFWSRAIRARESSISGLINFF